jgi:membrane dipeptidase
MRTLALLAVLTISLVAFAQNASPDSQAPARQIHDQAIVVDTHADTPQRILDDGYDLGQPNAEVNVNFEKAKAGNLGAEFFSIWVEPSDGNLEHPARRAFDLIDAVYQQAAKHPDQMVMAFSADDIVKARTGPKPRLAALMGIEGGHAIENDLHLLRDFYRLGARYMTLTWSNTNDWADSSGDIENPKVQHHNGLTPFGKEVVLEMNRLGMMVDISHVADKTFWDTLAVTKAPVIASHSSARALSGAGRNLTDDMLRAVAKNGGVVGVNFFSAFVDDNFRRELDRMRPQIDAAVAKAREDYKSAHPGKPVPYSVEEEVNRQFAAKLPRPPLKSLIDQFDHIAKVAGWQHVGLGSDFDGVSGMLPQGIDSAADLPKITAALAERGYTQEQITAMLGGNLLRVFRDVERISRELQP